MKGAGEEPVPLASAAAWSAEARPRPAGPLLSYEETAAPEPGFQATTESAPAPVAPEIDRLAALREIARKLRSAPDAVETLQFVVDSACRCTGADAGMLTVSAPNPQHVVCGSALGAGPYISVQLRAGGPTFGEIVLTRMSGALEFSAEDETFADLVAEYVAKGVSALRRGTVLSQDEQDFIDRVVEELRSPLSSAVGVLQSMLGGEGGSLTEAQKAYLTSVERDSARMLGMVGDLLTLAHLRPPELREMDTVPVTPWLKRAVERHTEEAQRRGIEIELTEPADPFMVKGVPAQLDLVLDHLIGNALKFSEPGGRVTMTAGLLEGIVRVDVCDDGMGFDNSDANRMLDCYARAINAEAARIPGAGIGLFLVRQIVANHTGRVWLESRRDEGTQAYVALPLAE